jgi:Fe2+ transport system protein FeoA
MNLQEGERALIISINGTLEFKNFLLSNGIALGSVLTKNYSPRYARLVNFTTSGKMLSLNKKDFDLLDLVKI